MKTNLVCCICGGTYYSRYKGENVYCEQHYQQQYRQDNPYKEYGIRSLSLEEILNEHEAKRITKKQKKQHSIKVIVPQEIFEPIAEVNDYDGEESEYYTPAATFGQNRQANATHSKQKSLLENFCYRRYDSR